MLSRVKRKVVNIFVTLFGSHAVGALVLLAKSQLSGNPLARGFGFVPFYLVDKVLGVGALRFIAHVSRREPKPRRRQLAHIRNRSLRAYFYLALGKVDKVLVPILRPDAFRMALVGENLDAESQYAISHQLFQAGKLNLAFEAFEDLIQRSAEKFPLEKRVQLLRDCGTASFMLGKIESAKYYRAKAGELRRFILGEESGPIYRIVGSTWFAAIGHVAMLDFYVKYNKLYRNTGSRFVAPVGVSGVPGNYLCERFAQTGIKFIDSAELTADYDRWARRHGKPRWSHLASAETFALVDEFWEFEFPDGQVLGYTHAADRIQKDWEGQQRPPLLSVTDGETQILRRALRLLGVPEGAWYVCLHVREPGFHKSWNTLYPSMRDANIEDYLPAIDLIVRNGGWVIRMGDPSMKPLPPLAGVIDYAHSTLKTPKADILIAVGCRFFLGTNSGLSTIPAIYGVRCVFSNWLPIGLPMWNSHDLMIPKLFWDKKQQRYLSLEEVFAAGLAYIQNWSDLPENISLRDNTPEDIRELAAEALGMTPELPSEGLDKSRESYREIAARHGSYVGGALAASFIRRYGSLCDPQALTSRGD